MAAQPKCPLSVVHAAAGGVGVRLIGSRAQVVVMDYVRDAVRAQLFAEKLVAALRIEHFVGVKSLGGDYAGDYDEYCLDLPSELVADFGLSPDRWYVGLKCSGETAWVVCVSMHPSTR